MKKMRYLLNLPCEKGVQITAKRDVFKKATVAGKEVLVISADLLLTGLV